MPETYNNRGFIHYNVYKDGVLIDSTNETIYDFGPLYIGETSIVGVEADYSSGISEIVTDTVIY